MIIVKIGGGGQINLKGIIKDLAVIPEPFIIIHGANAVRDRLASEIKYMPKVITSVSGFTSVFSDEKLIELQMMAYAGVQNKRIVELCHQYNINAVGLSGLDGHLIRGKRNQGIRVNENGKTRIIRDLSGKPCELNASLLDLLLGADYVPVISVPIFDEDNAAINSENDEIVALLHRHYRANKIFHLIEAPGLLDDPNDAKSLIPELNVSQLAEVENEAGGRFKRKIKGIRKVLSYGKTTVYIGDGRSPSPIKKILEGQGTQIHAV
ncbi:MAG: [LysW]-aminoadipate kinase [Candidatus Aminicenantes bacterium]|nr:[LysW]-aminoadipate kinase [Candidatus Aminicenantes bacterium]